MIGALIGAALSAASTVGNLISTKKRNDKRIKDINTRIASANSDAVKDRYGDWRYSGAQQYFNRAAEEMKDYVAQQRAARNVTGAVDNGTAVQAAGKTLGNAAGQASAQRQAVGMQMAQQDKSRAEQLENEKDNIAAQQSAATTQAWSQLASTAGNLATSLDSAGGNGKAKTDAGNKASNTTTPEVSNSSVSTIDFERAQTDNDYQQELKKQIKGGL